MVLPADKLRGSKYPRGARAPGRNSADMESLEDARIAVLRAGLKATAELTREAMTRDLNILQRLVEMCSIAGNVYSKLELSTICCKKNDAYVTHLHEMTLFSDVCPPKMDPVTHQSNLGKIYTYEASCK